MTTPNEYPRRVLLSACGMTPQVVTETLYCLRVAAEEGFAVNAVRIITTARGRDVARAALLVAGHFQRLCRDYGLDDIDFDESSIEVIHDAHGHELEDIRTPEQNAAAADCITDLIRRLTADPDTALHVSLAGGRKTMSYYTGYALSLFGRAQDQLSHVLVTANYETEPEFFYPTPDSQAIHTRDGRHLDASRATVMLARIPFVRLRDTLPARLLRQQTSFSEAVRWSNLDQAPESVEINLRARTLLIAGEPVLLSLKELALYSAFARARRDGEPEYEGGERNLQLTRALAEELVRIACNREPEDSLEALFDEIDDAGVDPRTLESLRSGIGVLYLRPVLTGIRNKLVEALGERIAHRYDITRCAYADDAHGRVPLYGLRVSAQAIHIRF